MIETCLVDVHLAISVDIRLLYKEVYFRVCEFSSELSHDVSQLLRVDRSRTVLVEKLFPTATQSHRDLELVRTVLDDKRFPPLHIHRGLELVRSAGFIPR